MDGIAPMRSPPGRCRPHPALRVRDHDYVPDPGAQREPAPGVSGHAVPKLPAGDHRRLGVGATKTMARASGFSAGFWSESSSVRALPVARVSTAGPPRQDLGYDLVQRVHPLDRELRIQNVDLPLPLDEYRELRQSKESISPEVMIGSSSRRAYEGHESRFGR